MRRGSSDIDWDQIGADFGSSNSLMKGAVEAYSRAGTVFGELRKSILDEEQKAIDNAYREKVFNENVNQFGVNYALEQDRLAENIRSNKAGEALTGRGQDMDYKASMANVGVQRARLNADLQDRQRLLNERALYAKTLSNVIEGNNQVQANNMSAIDEASGNAFSNAANNPFGAVLQNDFLNNPNITAVMSNAPVPLSSAEVQLQVARYLAAQGIPEPLTQEITKQTNYSEQQVANKQEQDIQSKKDFKIGLDAAPKQLDALGIIDKNQREGILSTLTQAKSTYGLNPNDVINALSLGGTKDAGFLDSSGKLFNFSVEDLHSFNTNPEDPSNPVAVMLAYTAGRPLKTSKGNEILPNTNNNIKLSPEEKIIVAQSDLQRTREVLKEPITAKSNSVVNLTEQLSQTIFNQPFSSLSKENQKMLTTKAVRELEQQRQNKIDSAAQSVKNRQLEAIQHQATPIFY